MAGGTAKPLTWPSSGGVSALGSSRTRAVAGALMTTSIPSAADPAAVTTGVKSVGTSRSGSFDSPAPL